MQEIPKGEKLIICENWNRHIGKDGYRYKRIYGGYSFGDRNEEGVSILEFAVAYDLIVANTFFKKRGTFDNL